MFTCPACHRRALNSVASEFQAPLFRGSDRTRTTARLLVISSKAFGRTHATLTSLKKGHHRRIAQKGLSEWAKNPPRHSANRRRKAPNALTKTEIRDALARERNRVTMSRQHVVEEYEEEDEDEAEDDPENEDTDEKPESIVRTGDSARKEVEPKEQEPTEKQTQKAIRAAQKEVEMYYRDPLQLAGGVLNRLRVPDIQGALMLVRASEAFDIDNVVSWNHCLDWLMAQGEIKQAIKIYNEMKKRGHRPDAHTYTLMLRGISQQIAPSGSLARTPTATTKTKSLVQDAVKIYNSIFAPNSAVKPSTIHTNAIINVCARGGDMESLWAVAGRLPEHGAGSPDHLTYTTILNAIRDNTVKEVAKTVEPSTSRAVDGISAERTRQKLYESALADGRKLWEEISYKWRRADLVMDEQLVCAMGRLLIGCGASKDVHQVLDLVDVCMNLKIRERRGARIANWLLAEGENQQQEEPQKYNDDGILQHDANGERGDSREAGELVATENAGLPFSQSGIYAKPTNNTLSMILHAAVLHPAVQSLSKHYWIRLTDPGRQYRIVPDAGNIVAYLRILRKTRSSHEAYKLLAREWPDDVGKELYRRATFIVAFSTCLRDKNNPNTFETARKMFELMTQKLESSAETIFGEDTALAELTGKARRQALKKRSEEFSSDPEELYRRQDGVHSMTVDPKILRYLIDLAIDTTHGWEEGIRGKDDGEKFERNPAKNHTMIALSMVQPHIIELQRLIKLKLDEMQYSDMPALQRARTGRRSQMRNDARYGTKVGEKIEDLLELMRTVIGAYDRVVDMADRFKKTRRAPIDASIVQQYDAAKRQYNVYMAKIDKTTKQKLHAADAFTTDVDLNEDEIEHGSEPDIGRQLLSIQNDVDDEVRANLAEKRQRKTQRKGFKHFETEDNKTPLRLSSRRQQRERENLLNSQMRKHFPETDYGELDDDLRLKNGSHQESNAIRFSNAGEKRLEDDGADSYIPFDRANASILANRQVQETWNRARI